MTPQTFYALRLQYFFAGIKEKDEEKVKYLGLILNFFETKCFQLGDEAHRNFDPLTRAIFGVGEYFHLPSEENDLFVELFKPLLGFEEVKCEGGQLVSELSRLRKNLLGAPSDADIKEVQRALATYMCRSSKLKIPKEHWKDLIEYWTHTKAKQPQYLLDIATHDRQKAGLIALTGYFILDLLPHIVKMRTELDHSRSIFQEEEFDTPCHHKTPSTTQYEDAHLGSALSVKGTAHRGLTEYQIRKLITSLLEKDWKEQKGHGTTETQSTTLFAEWVKETSFKSTHLRDIALSNPKQMEKLAKALERSPQVIEYYLTTFILPQVGYALEQLTCTPAHLANGFCCSILFTATPLAKQIYPQVIKEVRYDPAFEAEVVTEFCKKKNQKKMFVESPETFFTEMEKEPLFKGAHVFIDPAGFFCDDRNEEVVKKWLLASDLDGVFYFKEGRSLNVNKDEKVCLMLKSGLTIEIEGSNHLKEALAAHQLDWAKLKLGTYYDASHTESANILQKVGTTAYVYVADNLTASRLIQALMRLRGLLDEQMIQNVVWIYPKGVAKKIPLGSSKELDGAALFAWCVQNEVAQMEKRIILAGFQEIGFKIESPAAQELKKLVHDPKGQIALMEKYSGGFLEKNRHDPYGAYGEHEKDEKTAEVLRAYAKELYAKFGYTTPFDENTHMVEGINAIIEEVKKRIKTIPTNWGKKLSTEVEQHTRLQKETEQENYRPRPFDPLSSEGIYGDVGIDTPGYPFTSDIKPADEIFHTKGLTENFYLELNQRNTAKNAGKPMGENYLKPIDLFEIIITEKGTVAVVCINEITSTHLRRLEKETNNPELKHKAFIVSAEGKLIQKGKGVLAPTDEQIEKILKSQWMQDLAIDAALLRGEIIHPDRLLERIKTWKDFPQFWEKIVQALPNPENANRPAMNRLMAPARKGAT